MKRIPLLLILMALAGCRGGDGAAPDPEVPPPIEWSADMQTIAEGNNRFALELFAKLRESENGNLFFSPYSIHTALGMTATGAKGTTRDQMVQVLHLPADEQKALASGDMGRYYAHPRRHVELSVANAIWGQKSSGWRPEWLALQQDRFGAGFQEADFQTNPNAERQRINQWVEEKTQKRIKELLRRDQVTNRTRMVLANAIYFKGKWAEQFDSKKTHEAPFHLGGGKTVQVPTMHGAPPCRIGHLADVEVLELPYKGSELSMVIILPTQHDGLPSIEKQLSAEAFGKWIGALQEAKDWPVSLPPFRIESRFDLPPQLQALGMIDAFQDGVANFNGMRPGAGLCIGHVAHKAFVEVNEEGTEAAAATAVVMREKSAPRTFEVDHPFLFLIRDVKHGTILFLGRVTNPKG